MKSVIHLGIGISCGVVSSPCFGERRQLLSETKFKITEEKNRNQRLILVGVST